MWLRKSEHVEQNIIAMWLSSPSPSSQASKRSRFMARMADREPISLLDSEENCIVETSVEAANIAAPAKKANFRWSD